MGASAKMDVDISGFKKGMQDAQTILKGLNAELKASEAEFKATGNAEKLMTDKTQALTSKLNIQKSIVDKTQAALKDMKDKGVDPADKAYQQLYAQLMNAQAGMYETQAALNGLGTSAQQAATGADQLTKSVNGISKKVSLDQVISGIDKITSGLENAAKKAVHLGEELWNAMLASAQQADDDATMAAMYGIDLQKFLKMKKLVTNGLDTSVDAMLGAQRKLKNGIGSDSKAVAEAFESLGISMQTWQTVAGQSGPTLRARDSMELFWEAGQKILALDDEFAQESMAQALFGKSWRDLTALFTEYKSLEEYEAALDGVNTESEQSVKNLAEFNDEAGKLSGNLNSIKTEVLGALAPALTEAAKAINGVLDAVLEYLQSDAGQQALADMSSALTELFSGLSEISAEDVVQGFQTAFNAVLGCLDWIVQNKNGIVTALEVIGGAFAALKIAEFALNIGKTVNGLRDLTTMSSAGNMLAAGESAGASFGTGFGAAIMKAVPWLAGALVLTKNAYTPQGNDDLYDKEGKLTDWGKEVGAPELDEQEAAIIEAQTRIIEDRAKVRAQERAEAMQFDPAEMIAVALGGIFSIPYLEYKKTRAGGGSSAFEIQVQPVPVDNAAEQISKEIGVVQVPATLVMNSYNRSGKEFGYANGIDFVPNTRLAWLHKGERVVTAREVSSRSFSSNLYVENMNMGGGLSADALASAIASRNRRIMAGYGS